MRARVAGLAMLPDGTPIGALLPERRRNRVGPAPPLGPGPALGRRQSLPPFARTARCVAGRVVTVLQVLRCTRLVATLPGQPENTYGSISAPHGGIQPDINSPIGCGSRMTAAWPLPRRPAWRGRLCETCQPTTCCSQLSDYLHPSRCSSRAGNSARQAIRAYYPQAVGSFLILVPILSQKNVIYKKIWS